MQIKELDKLVETISENRDKKTKLTEELKKVNALLDELNSQLISNLVNIDKTAWDVKGVGKASVTTKTLFSIKDQHKLVNHLIETDNQGLIKVSPNVMSGYLKELMAELPVENQNEKYLEEKFGVSFYKKTGVSLRKQR
jgi:hypothetical protein